MRKGTIFCALAILAMANWATAEEPKAPEKREVMVAKRAAEPVKVDGKLSDAVWKQAQVYSMHLADDCEAKGAKLREGGKVRLAWDDDYLYIGVKYFDSDVVAKNNENQTHHFLTGDVAEVFVKPVGNKCYWELYVTPHSKTSTYWFAEKGAKEPDPFKYQMEISVAGQTQGTLNDSEDKDKSWTGEMAIPIKELTRHGDKFDPETPWTILVARYNYNRYLGEEPELSMTPKLPITSYHYLEGYAELKLEKAVDAEGK